MLFKKDKNKKSEKPIVDYTNWEKDFGFLNMILSRKKGITKEYLIKVYSKQKSEKYCITDEEVSPIIERTIIEVIEQIGGEYKNFLITKYFGSEENLIKFISEDVYVDLVTDTINENITKIKLSMQKKLLDSVNILNKKK